MDGSLSGTRLGKYEIQAEVGRGGMGAVYKGYDPALDRYVAIKVLAPHLVWEQEFVERFLREARAAARLKHANIVTIHDVGQEAGWYYFVMEYLEGPTLTAIVQERGAIPPGETLSILRPLADALDYAHQQGLVHRDIKPGNIIVGPTGSVTLTDFGIARAAQETRLTSTGTIVGTPEYMSPEQAKGSTVNAPSDQYSLAVAAYEMLSGRVPFEAESTLALLHKIVYDPLPPIREINPDLPAGVEAVLKKALAKDPHDRYKKTSAFVEALGRALAGEEIVKKPTVMMRPESPVAPGRAIAKPKPERVALPELDPGRTKVLRDEQPTTPFHRRVPAWAWALGGLVGAVTLVALLLVSRPPSPIESTPTTGNGESQSPALASGDPILFTSDRDGRLEIYHLAEAGKVARVTHTPNEGNSWAPVLLPDRTILFVSDRDGKREIYYLTGEGEIARITHTPGEDESWSPAVMPDGTILFVSDRDGKREIYHLTGEGKIARITHTPGGGESWAPAVMLDGTILFVSDRDGKREIYHLTGEGETARITHTPGGGESWAPTLTPDGDILFVSDRDGKREVYHLTGTGEIARITHTPGEGESWSPALMIDGTILFTSDRDGKSEVYHLTQSGAAERITNTPGNGKSWSADWQ